VSVRRHKLTYVPITFLTQDELPAAEFSRELVGADFGGVEASVIFVDAAPGEGPSLHEHDYAELFFVLDGEATFSDGNDERTVGAGGVVIVPPGQPHAFVNRGSSRLRQIDVHLSARFATRWL
jgi:mannose-6-phosphate isomerase-like protein (cupin superfamily)